MSSENRSSTTTSSTLSSLPVTPPVDATQLALVPTSDDDNWPTPPSPISEARAAAAAPLSTCGGEETSRSSSPVMRFTFTVKLDSQLLKRRRQRPDDEQATENGAAAVQLAVEDIANDLDDDDDDDPTPSASPPQTRFSSSKQRPAPPPPEMAVVIPDVVVCADAVDNRKQGVVEQAAPALRQYCVQVLPSQTADTVSQSKQQQQQQRGCTASRSCQTELCDIPATTTAQNQMCLCSCSCARNAAAETATDTRDDVVRLDGSDDVDQLSCRCSSLIDVDNDDDLWLQPEVSRSTGGVRVDDGSYLRPLVTRIYPADRNDMHADGELTHMSWSEVLKEAQTMGIPLHLRTMSAACAERQRHPSCSASSAVTSASATPVKRVPDNDDERRRRTTPKPAADSGGSGTKNKKTPSTSSLSGIKTSFRDLLRLPQLFGGRKKSSGASSDGSRVRRSKSMEPARQRVVQTRGLPTPPNNMQSAQRHQREPSSASAADADRTRHWVMSRSSRYSAASSCPSTRCHHRLRSRQGHVDYCPGGGGGSTSWATSSCSGSLPAYRHRCTAAASAEFDLTDEMVVSVDDVVCASPSVSSFSSVCTAPWRTHHAAMPSSTLSNSVTSSSLASPGQLILSTLYNACVVNRRETRFNCRLHTVYN